MSNKSKKGNGNGGDGQSKLAKQRSQVMQMKAEIGPHILPAVFMVGTNTSYARLLQDSQDYSSFKVVLFYCSLIVFLPVVTFFALKGFILDQFFTMSEMKVNIGSAVGAVAALHVALGLYIYRAYFGGSSGSKAAQSKQD